MVEIDLSELPSDIIRSTLSETIESQLKSNKFNVSIESASKAGENNFIGVVYRVTFNKSDETADKSSISKLILKVSPQSVARRAQFHSRDFFLREIYLYNEVLPYFRQFEKSRGIILEENGFTEYPKCYTTLEIEPSESLYLEDLSARKFDIIDRYTQLLTADHVKLVMKTLGKLHAISFALKDQDPEKFKELSSEIQELFIRTDNQGMKDYMKMQADSSLSVLSAEEDTDVLAKVTKLFEKNAMDIANECLDLEATGSASVITHGDSWQNNIMFKYDKDGKPSEICLLDWQVSRQSSPIIDLVYFMFTCTTKQLRDDHYDDFLKTYHQSLSEHIQRLGSDPLKLFPWNLMMEHFHKFAKFGLVTSIMLLPMITTEQGKGIDMDELAEHVEKGEKLEENVFISEKSRNKFNERMRDVFIDMVRLEYI